MQPKNKIPVLSRSGLQLAKATDNSLSLINQLIDEGNPEYWYKKAVKAKEEEKWEEAFYSISKSVRLNNKESKYWLTQGYLAAKIENPHISAISFSKALYYRENWKVLCNNIRQNDWIDIKEYFQKQESVDYTIAFAQAFLEEACDAPEKSLEILNSLSQDLTLNDLHFYELRALVNFDLDDLESAKDDLREIIRLDPVNVRAYYNLGRAQYELEEFSLSLKDFSKAIELNPLYYDAFLKRGILYDDLKMYSNAILDYTHAIEINPNSYEPYFNRALAKCDLNDELGAIEDYTKAIELNPTDSECYLLRGMSKEIIDDFKGALKDYNQAILINPQYTDAIESREKLFKEMNC